MAKVLFLDIDGVLNASYESEPLILPECARRFNRIIRETGAKVVISSSWRNFVHGGLMIQLGFQTLLRTHGVHCQIVGVTQPDEGRRGAVGRGRGPRHQAAQRAEPRRHLSVEAGLGRDRR